ncbi:MAG: hypothetical protein V7K98_02705 [Nostoc sp.]|uniref:hypothetical protein n=1 Tax=Nostoc sp. TaxID=1180 RepID=UPI002FF80C81
MTSSADEIQKLIADIDNLLASGGKRLSRFLPGQAQEPKEVLERIRNFLVRLQEKEALESGIANQSSEEPRSPLALSERSPLLTKFIDRGYNQYPLPPLEANQEESSVVSGQLKNEFSSLIQPLRSELERLLQEQATLIQEIRQLEQRRLQNYSLAQQLTNQDQMITEFLQVLMSRLVPTLTPLLAQTGENSAISSGVINQVNSESATSVTQPLLESADRVEQLTQLARELDQRLLSLDGTVNVVFEALQRNINTYYESLSQALARMHGKGMEGEQLMSSFLNNLTQHLQQQSPNSPSSISVGESDILPSLPELAAIAPETAPQPLEQILPEISFPPIINSEQQDTTLTDDLDAVLLQLGIDSSQSSETPTELTQDISALVGDEVDQLYASLFGTGDFNNLSLDVATNDLSASTAFQNIAESPSIPPTGDSAVVIQDTGISAQETLVETTDLSPQPQEELFFEEDTDLDSPFSFPTPQTDSSPTELDPQIASFFEEDTNFDSPFSFPTPQTDSSPTQLDTQSPASVDTINALTELLPDTVSEQEVVEVEISSFVDSGTTTATVTPEVPEIALAKPTVDVASPRVGIAPPEILIDKDQPEPFVDNYIAASPQENLLYVESNQSPAIPDISLDEEQLQQLDRDLANFDRQLNSESQPSTNFDISSELIDKTQDTIPTTPPESQTENTSTATLSSLAVPQVETEEKKEVTTPIQDSSLPSISNSTNNPEVSLHVGESVWYLGIDLGTTGISATLLNRSTFVVHPIYWSAENPSKTSPFQQSFRLPTEVYLPTASIPQGENESIEVHDQTVPAAVAQDKTPDHSATTPTTTRSTADSTTNNLYSAQLKPYLQIAIPYKSERQKWEPVLQLNEFSAGPLIWVVRSLSKLLLTLKSEKTSTTPNLMAAALGIGEQDFPQIINNIAGVICTCPFSWSEQYRFNVREALLTSKLIQHPQQVFFVEEAIASLLPELDAANGEQVKLSQSQGSQPAKTSEHSIVGNTLVINIGTSATEMLLVDVPENLLQLTYNDFMLHSFAYAGKGIEQDIICQLLLPPKSRQSRRETQSNNKTTSSNPWQWQPSIPGLDQMRWQSLGLEELGLPRVGEPDITARIRLQQRLESSLLGQAVLEAALAIKLILQHQESFTLELADQQWILQRRDLESQVFIPFVRRLNRELNKILVARGIPTESINQAILTGGVACVGTVNRWLRQKLPSAKIIQDLYLGENGSPNCSRVAYGLAMLPLHPQILDIPRQQYTDYFLFTELLRLLPERPLSFGEVIQLFEGRGINTRTCQERLLAFLEGELPSGLIPSVTDSTWLTQSSQENPDYEAIATTPLFEKQGSLTYRPNSQQLLSLRRYLDAIKASNQQSLNEPYKVNFALEVDY